MTDRLTDEELVEIGCELSNFVHGRTLVEYVLTLSRFPFKDVKEHILQSAGIIYSSSQRVDECPF